MAGTPKVTRLTVEVDGYQWRVHGHQAAAMWHVELAELVGSLAYNMPVDKKLASNIRAAISEQLEGARVGYVSPELILVTEYRNYDRTD